MLSVRQKTGKMCWAGGVSLHPTPRCFPAVPCQDVGQLWCARSSWTERGMQQDEAPLLFCWEMSPGSFPLGSNAGVFAVSLGGLQESEISYMNEL